MKFLKGVFGSLGALASSATVCFGEWTPLVTAADFTGPRADVNTFALGLLGILIIIMAVGLIARILR